MFVDHMGSGEPLTTSSNNLMNASIRQVTYEELKRRGFDKLIKAVRVVFMGDDSLEIIKTLKTFTYDDYVRLVTLYEEVASGCGFEFNSVKSMTRRFSVSFLSVTYTYGVRIPNMLMLPLGAEKPNDQDFCLDMVASYASKMTSMCFRLFSHRVAYRLVVAAFIFRGRLRAARGDTRTWVILPIGLLFTPRSMGGVGLYPGCILGASRGDQIAMLASQHPEFRDHINTICQIYNVPSSDRARETARALLESRGVRPANVFEPGLKFSQGRLKRDLIESSTLAEEWLRARGLTVGALHYTNTPKLIVQRALSGNPKMRELNQLARNSNVDVIIDRLSGKRRAKGKRFVEAYPWTTTVDISQGETLPPVLSVRGLPTQCVGRDLLYLYSYLGFTKGTRESVPRPDVILRKVRRGGNIVASDQEILGLLAARGYLDLEVNTNTLAALGVDPHVAAEVAMDVASSEHSGMLGLSSIVDSIIPTFDNSMEAYSRRVTIEESRDGVLSNSSIERFLRVQAAAYLIYESVRTITAPRHVTVKVANEYVTKSSILKGARGWKFERGKFYTDDISVNGQQGVE
jgi:nucleotide-binding universal stress UspA family protein